MIHPSVAPLIGALTERRDREAAIAQWELDEGDMAEGLSALSKAHAFTVALVMIEEHFSGDTTPLARVHLLPTIPA